MGFPRPVYWSELPFPSPGDLPNPGIKPMSPALASRFFTAKPPGKPKSAILGFYSKSWGPPASQADPCQEWKRQIFSLFGEAVPVSLLPLENWGHPSRPISVFLSLWRLIGFHWFAVNVPQMDPDNTLILYISNDHTLLSIVLSAFYILSNKTTCKHLMEEMFPMSWTLIPKIRA